MHFEEKDMDIDQAVKGIMLDFDNTHDSRIDMDEFIKGITRWLKKAKRSATQYDHSPTTPKFLNNFHQVC